MDLSVVFKSVSFFLFFLVTPSNMWDLSSLTRDRTRAHLQWDVWSLKDWTTGKVSLTVFQAGVFPV